MHAVGTEQEAVVRPEIVLTVIGTHALFEAHGAHEHMAHVGMAVHVVAREQGETTVAQAVDARVAHMHHVGASGAEHERTQGRRHAAPFGPAARLGVESTVHRVERARLAARSTPSVRGSPS